MADFIDSSYIAASNLDINPGFTGQSKLISELIDASMYHDVRPLLGNELYGDLVTNPTATARGDYPELLNGSTYTHGVHSYIQKGVKYLTLLFWYRRYVNRPYVDTHVGYAHLEGDNITKISDRERRNKYDEITKQIKEVWGEIWDYLNRDGNYSYWYSGEPGAYIDDDESNININKATLS